MYKGIQMESTRRDVYFVFLNYDPEYERLQSNRRTKNDTQKLDLYLTKKHNDLLNNNLKPGTYKKKFSLAIVDAFAVEITNYQADVLRSIEEVRLVDKNQELSGSLKKMASTNNVRTQE